MREHDYLNHTSHAYRQSMNNARRSADSAATYRNDYLALRKLLREYSKDTGHVFPDNIKKAIGQRT